MKSILAGMGLLAVLGMGVEMTAPGIDEPLSEQAVVAMYEPYHERGWAIPIAYDPGRYRYNIQLTANPNIPNQVWAFGHTFCAAIQCQEDGTFPVRVVKRRLYKDGTFDTWEAIVQMPMGMGATYSIQNAQEVWDLEKGDVLYVLYNPGLMSWTGGHMTTGPGTYGPIVSIIDQRSQDPTSMFPVLGSVVR